MKHPRTSRMLYNISWWFADCVGIDSGINQINDFFGLDNAMFIYNPRKSHFVLSKMHKNKKKIRSKNSNIGLFVARSEDIISTNLKDIFSKIKCLTLKINSDEKLIIWGIRITQICLYFHKICAILPHILMRICRLPSV